jgi:hypothetical protein
MLNIYSLQELQKKEWKSTIVFIGRGQEINKYIFNNNKVDIISINDSFQFYNGITNYTAIVEAHLSKNLPICLKENHKIQNVIVMTREEIKKNELVIGCTPSLIISYFLKYLPIKKVYLQGFSMDGAVQMIDPTILHRQKMIFADAYNIGIQKGYDEALKYYEICMNHEVGVPNVFPYEWDRQVKAFDECFNIAKEKNIEMGFVSINTKIKNRNIEINKDDILQIN